MGGTIRVRTAAIAGAAVARWFNPRLGEWSEPQSVTGPTETFQTPDSDDWVLWVGRARN